MKDPKAVAAVRERRERANDARMHACVRERMRARTNERRERANGRTTRDARDGRRGGQGNIAREKAGD